MQSLRFAPKPVFGMLSVFHQTTNDFRATPRRSRRISFFSTPPQ
jgi:hypothetical protein